MSTTQFQTVHQAIQGLFPKITTIQQYASQPRSPLYTDITLRTYSQVFNALVTELHNAASNARTTANFLVNNLYSTLLNPNQSKEAKQLATKRFLESQRLSSGARDALSLWNKFNQLKEALPTQAQVLTQMGINPTAVVNHMQTVLGGVNNIQKFYQQVEQSIRGFKGQLDQGTDRIQGVEHEVRWLTAMSEDLKNI
ncbi:hypothetical protein QCA50_013534 [Cerrena zonata]|uniref:Uncharacterized protein n=1 Tax=Cerrena zonata TaxID=2478898 RepID=A0AAW0FT42_9APHY